MSALLDDTAADSVAERCSHTVDEDGCNALSDCAWYAANSSCGPKCETLGAGPCKNPAFGCGWNADGKCTTKTDLGENAPTGCPAFTNPTACNAGGLCGWDGDDNFCYTSCQGQSTSDGCGKVVSRDGTPRCLWANGKCSRQVLAQCQPLWEDTANTVGVVAGTSYQPLDAGQTVVIVFIMVAALVLFIPTLWQFGRRLYQARAARLGAAAGPAAAAAAP